MKGTEQNKAYSKDLIAYITNAAIEKIEKCNKSIKRAEEKCNTHLPIYKNSMTLKHIIQEVIDLQWDDADADIIADIGGGWKIAINVNPKIIIAESKEYAGAK